MEINCVTKTIEIMFILKQVFFDTNIGFKTTYNLYASEDFEKLKDVAEKQVSIFVSRLNFAFNEDGAYESIEHFNANHSSGNLLFKFVIERINII